MPPEELKRKLAAILSADVAGYSLLMRDNEEATVRTLTDYRKAMGTLIQQYSGRVVDSPGDNLLAEFSSVVDAVNCAVEVQRDLAVRNAELPKSRRMEFRIGLNLGDVVTEGERIYGDGVNIAARMEGLAEDGGICLSGAVYDAIENKIGLEYEYLGEQDVKNITKPVRTYRVLWSAHYRLPVVKGILEEKKSFELPDGPSIAVLPFVNMSTDPDQEYFSDGLTENIIAGLSGDERLLVIARNSTFSYKGRPVKVQEVARELGAQYVVEGSVQKTKDRVRITAQLINASTGHHVWTGRYDRNLEDIFALQDEITMEIIQCVGVKLVSGETYGDEFLPPSGNLEVYMKAMKARGYMFHMNREDNILARQELEEAISLDPEYSILYSALAWTHLMALFFHPSDSPESSFAKAGESVEKALALGNEDWMTHVALSQLNLLRKDHDEAISAAERAIIANPSGADAYAQLGFVLIMSGRAEEGINFIEKAMRLNPIPPHNYLLWLGYAYRFLGRYEDAIEVFTMLLKRSPNNLFAHIWLTATYSAFCREEEARRQSQELLRLDPTFSLVQFAEILAIKDEVSADRFINDLRKAGLK